MLALDVGVFLVEVHGETEEVHDEMAEVPQEVQEEWTSSLAGLIWTWRKDGIQSELEPGPHVPWEVEAGTPFDSWLGDSFHVAPRVHVGLGDHGHGLVVNLQRCVNNEPSVAADERRGNVDGG